MTKFLWIEDFPSKGDPRATVADVFGALIGDNSKILQLSEVKQELVSDLERYGVYLQLTLTNALRFIRDPDKLASIDFILLDIDLQLYRDGSREFREVIDILQKWYEYSGGYPTEYNFDELAFNAACDSLKEKAGYHIWAELVIDIGFPRDRILFCSDHGDNLNSIKNAFRAAKLDIPATPHKSDQRIKDAVNGMIQDRYVFLRRSLIETCKELLDGIGSSIEFRLPKLPGHGATYFSDHDARDFLTLVPNILPMRCGSDASKQRALRQLVSTITHPWERIDPRKIDEQIKAAKKQRENSPWDDWLYAYTSTLKFVRNSISHSSSSLTELDEGDVIFLFLLNLRAMFIFDRKTQPFEVDLLNRLADTSYQSVAIDDLSILKRMRNSFDEIFVYYDQNTQVAKVVFHDMLRNLQRECHPRILDRSLKRVLQLLWHNLYQDPWDFVNGKNLNPKNFVFHHQAKNNKFVVGLVKALFSSGRY